MLPNELMVITPATTCFDLSNREPLYRLSIPIERVPEHFRFPREPVWWSERRGQRVWLRGYFRVGHVTNELALGSFSRRLVLHPLSLTAERLTWPGTFDVPEAEISSLLARHHVSLSRNTWVARVPQKLGLALERKRDSLVELAWSYHMAMQLLHRTALPLVGARRIAEFSGDMHKARDFAIRHMARAELVGLPGQDPYEVTAAILAGYSQMPVASAADGPSRSEADSTDHFEFSQLKPDDSALVAPDWSQSVPGIPHATLERADGRHQEILRSLALLLTRKGYSPTYNQFVDLRIEAGRCEILFEIKTADDEGFSHQARLAVGQLLEYRFRSQKANGDKSHWLVAVVENISDANLIDFERDFLASIGIELVLWDSRREKPIGLEALLDGRLSPPLSSCAVSAAH